MVRIVLFVNKTGDLWRTEIKENKDIASKRKRKAKFVSNILVISDQKNRDNEGKVFLFKYGTKIFEKIKQAIKPEFEDEISFDPFCPLTGAEFKLKIRNYEGYRNYDKSEFDKCSPLFEDEELIEKVLDSLYPIDEFDDPIQFKTFDELQKRFNNVVGFAPKKPKPAERQVETAKTETPKVASVADEDDDDFDSFSSLFDE